MKILLAEDEEKMSEALTEILRLENYDVDAVADGMSALCAIECGIYDIAILDVMLPELNGFEVVSKVRKSGNKLPILMLTAKNSLDDKIFGLDNGADDYLTKPFITKELLAHIRALSRRASNSADGKLKYGDIMLDAANNTLICTENERSIRMSEKEFRIIEYLMSNHTQVISRNRLATKIWGYDNDSEYNNVEVYISYVRKKLSYVQSKVEIKAIRGMGYELRYGDI